MAVGTLHLSNQGLGFLPGVPALITDIPVEKRLCVLVVQPGHLWVFRFAFAVAGAL